MFHRSMTMRSMNTSSLSPVGGGGVGVGGLESLDSTSSFLLPENETMQRVREEYTKLQHVVVNLNSKLNDVMVKQESEFLAAYRAHMYTVQRDLASLKHKVVEAETALHKNEKVKKLEEDCEWYRSEALRLDGFATAMKKDLKYMKDKVEALEEENVWYIKQLKASKRQSRLLLAELEARQRKNHHYGASITNTKQEQQMKKKNADYSEQQQQQQEEEEIVEGEEEEEGEEGAYQLPACLGLQVAQMIHLHPNNLAGGVAKRNSSSSSNSNIRRSNSRIANMNSRPQTSAEAIGGRRPVSSTTSNTDATTNNINKHSNHQQQGEGDPSSFSSSSPLRNPLRNTLVKEDQQSLASQIRELRRQVAEEKEMAAHLRSIMVTSHHRRGELEEFFLQALEDVKRETKRRRRAAASHHPSSLPSVRDHDQETKEKEEGQKEEEAVDQRERIVPQTSPSPCSSPSIKHHQRLGQLAFNPHDYTGIDRAAVIYRMLGQDGALQALQRLIFPSASTTTGRTISLLPSQAPITTSTAADHEA